MNYFGRRLSKSQVKDINACPIERLILRFKMVRKQWMFHFIVLLFFASCHCLYAQSYSQFVNPQIGSEGEGLGCGYCFIGATYPFGMVQFSPGFFTPRHGFAITQLSGAGCANMGNFPVLPVRGVPVESPNDMNGFAPYKEVISSSAGYLSVKMEDNTFAELTVTKRSGIARFTFSNDTGTVMIGSGVNATVVENARIEITSRATCEGFCSGGDFCGVNTPYIIYFAAEFDRDADGYGTWMQTDKLDAVRFAYGKNSGAYFSFNTRDDREVGYRIAISYVSVENARENLIDSSLQKGFDVCKESVSLTWDENLGKIKIDSKDEDELVKFYTHFYHALIHPNIVSDANGEYIGADYKIHQASKGRDVYSSYSVWDTYRTQSQLIAMLYPKEAGDMMQSLVDFAEQAGGYGRWILSNIETGIMQGDPTPILIANSYAFGATDFDVQKAFEYMKKGATVTDSYAQNRRIRPFLKSYNENHIAPASILLEYASSDYAIGQFALSALNDEQQASFFTSRSYSWKNLYNPEMNWLCSRNEDGTWKSITSDWREGTYKNYFWMVPHDLETLIDTIGGKRVAEERLDSLFTRLDASYEEEWFAAGNEPDFQIPWIYNWTDSPSKTNEVIHRIFSEEYNSTPSGLPGNDDLGAMGAWYVFASIGLYPMIPGTAGFTVNIPRFPHIIIELEKGKLTIEGGSSTNTKIKKIRLNEKIQNLHWLDWKALQNGGKIQFVTK